MVVKYLFGSNYIFPSFLHSVVDTDILSFLFFPSLEERCADKEIVCNFTKKDQTKQFV